MVNNSPINHLRLLLLLLTIPTGRGHFIFHVHVVWRQGLKSFVWILSSGYCLDAFPCFIYCTRLTLKLCCSLICSSARDPIIAFTNAKIETRKVILRFHGLNCLVMLPNFCNFMFNRINSLILPIFKDGPRPHFFRQITSKLI